MAGGRHFKVTDGWARYKGIEASDLFTLMAITYFFKWYIRLFRIHHQFDQLIPLLQLIFFKASLKNTLQSNIRELCRLYKLCHSEFSPSLSFSGRRATPRLWEISILLVAFQVCNGLCRWGHCML